MRRHQSIRDLLEVARNLGLLVHEVVFLGGAVVPLLVPDAVSPTIRSTDDVDCVIRTETYHDYLDFGERLRRLGFQEYREPGAPICRWTLAGILLDVMPTGPFLGFFNPWYRQVVEDCEEVELAPDVRIRIASLPAFLATKFEALAGRGGEDYLANPDFEDIITLLGTREDAREQIQRAPVDIRDFLKGCSRKLLERKDLGDLLSGCFAADPVSQAAVPRVLAVLRELSAFDVP